MARSIKKTASVTDSPEFKAALEAGIATGIEKATAQIMAMLSARTDAPPTASAAPPPGPSLADRSFADALAMSIAQIGTQGVGKIKPVAPEVMAERTAAHGRMVKLIVDAYKACQVARAEGDQEALERATPIYRLRDKVYFGEQIVQPMWIEPGTRRQRQTEIEWFRAPNHSMVPHNDIAQAIHAEFMQWTGTKPETPLDDLRDLAMTASGFVVRGGSASLQSKGSLRDVEAQHTGAETHQNLGGLRVRSSRGVGGTREVNVLGTLHRPAIENA